MNITFKNVEINYLFYIISLFEVILASERYNDLKIAKNTYKKSFHC